VQPAPSTTAATEDPYFTSDKDSLEGQARIMSVQVSKTSKDYSLGTEGQNDIQDAVNKIYQAAIINGEDIQKSLDKQEKAVNSILSK
jgi:putative chitobiose transport system substrate-binding protein